MKRHIWIILFGLLLTGCTGDVTSVHILLDRTYTLPESSPNHTVVALLDGDVNLTQGSQFEGSTFIISGDYNLAGTYTGNLTVFGGTLTIGDSATVDGIVNIAGGQVNISPDAIVKATIQEGDVQIPQATLTTGKFWLDQIVWFFVETIPVILLALMLRRWWWQPFVNVETALMENTMVSAAMGLLVGIVTLVLMVVMAFTLILLPLAMLGLLVLFIAIAAGIIATSHVLFSMFSRRTGIEINDWLALVIGVFIMMLLLNLIENVPFSSIITVPLLTIGLGAVALTRGGTRPFETAHMTEQQ